MVEETMLLEGVQANWIRRFQAKIKTCVNLSPVLVEYFEGVKSVLIEGCYFLALWDSGSESGVWFVFHCLA